jgi:hypothetical protein
LNDSRLEIDREAWEVVPYEDMEERSDLSRVVIWSVGGQIKEELVHVPVVVVLTQKIHRRAPVEVLNEWKMIPSLPFFLLITVVMTLLEQLI